MTEPPWYCRDWHQKVSYCVEFGKYDREAGNSTGYLETIKGAMCKMGIAGGQQVLTLTTDNPTVMHAFRRDFQK